MQIKIVSRWDSDKILFEGEFETLANALVEAASKRADLQGADLQGAYLRGAYLQGADLRGVDLRGADLRGVDLQGADLRGADLQGADLQGADLRGVDLRGVDASNDTVVTTNGETLGQWKAEVLPALLAAAPHVISAKAWDCHSWDNCPMAEAFGIKATADAPPLLRGRVAEFVWLYDAGLLKSPVIGPGET